MKSPDVLVVVPQKGRQAMTETLLRQIRVHEDAPILVVDDASDDADLDALREIPGVEVVVAGGDGVTAAWNIGLARAEGRAVLLLNNDVVCRGPFLTQLVEAAGPKGMSGAALRHDPDAQMKVLEGWCMCIGPQLAARLKFDESMRLYFSDTDYQLRAKVAPQLADVPLTHIGHATCHDETILPRPARRIIWRNDRDIFRRRWRANRAVPH